MTPGMVNAAKTAEADAAAAGGREGERGEGRREGGRATQLTRRNALLLRSFCLRVAVFVMEIAAHFHPLGIMDGRRRCP